MNIRKIAGHTILLSPLVAVVAGLVFVIGWAGALVVTSTIGLVYGMTALGMYLVETSDY